MNEPPVTYVFTFAPRNSRKFLDTRIQILQRIALLAVVIASCIDARLLSELTTKHDALQHTSRSDLQDGESDGSYVHACIFQRITRVLPAERVSRL